MYPLVQPRFLRAQNVRDLNLSTIIGSASSFRFSHSEQERTREKMIGREKETTTVGLWLIICTCKYESYDSVVQIQTLRQCAIYWVGFPGTASIENNFTDTVDRVHSPWNKCWTKISILETWKNCTVLFLQLISSDPVAKDPKLFTIYYWGRPKRTQIM
jgi:hypothetical protein